MFKKLVVIALALTSGLNLFAADRRDEIKNAILSRYRENGASLVIQKDGLYGLVNPINAARREATQIMGNKAYAITTAGDYAFKVGDVIKITKVSIRNNQVDMHCISDKKYEVPTSALGRRQYREVFLTLQFPLPKAVIEKADMERIYAVMDPWILPSGLHEKSIRR